ncbi:MAG: hypothetical protein GY870_14475 [archaeon]|nr:hypothetical protein [archaeon]
MIKKVEITICSLDSFNKYVQTPQTFEVSDEANILEIISMLDKELYKVVSEKKILDSNDFIGENMKSLLQVIWNPVDQSIYEDVGVEARTAPPESSFIPLKKKWNEEIPDGAWIVLTPDIGC